MAGCAADPGTGSTAGSSATTTAAEPAAGEAFGYTGATGPAEWASLDPGWAVCDQGEEQSPVDLGAAVPGQGPTLSVAYEPGAAVLVNTGATVRADEPPGSALLVDGVRSELTQFHLHEPAEHVVDGVRAEAELHLVHTATDGSLTVVGVLLTDGADDVALQPYLDALPPEPGSEGVVELDPTALLPADLTAYSYPGSLTTPPCAEDVDWFVLQQPVEVSTAQLAAFREVVGENARPVQPLGDRTVTADLPG